MDTLGISALVGPGTAERLAAKLTRTTRRDESGSERTRAYGALRLSTVTLFPTDRVEGARLCVEFSAPRVLFGENATAVSALGARIASTFVLDEIESESGVRWASRSAQEVSYDKHAELLQKAAQRDRQRGGLDFPDDSGLPDEGEALANAMDATAGGGLRIEVRLRGSHYIRTTLKLERATFEAVVTDENAAVLLARFIAQLGYVADDGPPKLARALADDGFSGRRLLQLVGLHAMRQDGSTDEQCRDLRRLRATQYRQLKSSLDRACVHAAGEGQKNPLVVTRDDLAQTAKRDRETVETWLERRRTWRRHLNLSADSLGLLEAPL